MTNRLGRYLDPFGDPVEAIRWDPSSPAAVGACAGWLMANRADFHHPDGMGDTTTLAIRRANGQPDAKAQPGDWVVGKRRPRAFPVFAVVSDDAFGKVFTVDTAVYR